MNYISDASYSYIINKYHDVSKPFNSRDRFTRNDSIFDSSTGLDPELIQPGILDNDRKYQNCPHSIRKARALEYVLDNTRIDCDERDIFPAINSIDRPIEKTLILMWHTEIFQTVIPEVTERMDLQKKAGVTSLYPDYNHTLPVWDTFFSLGLSGVLSNVREAKLKLEKQKTLSA